MRAIQQVLSSYLSVPPLPAGATARWNVLSNSAGLLATADKKLQWRASAAGNIAVTPLYHSEA